MTKTLLPELERRIYSGFFWFQATQKDYSFGAGVMDPSYLFLRAS
jgi:hypothetical protein